MAEVENRACDSCEQSLPLASFRKNKNCRGGHTNRCKACLLALDDARWAAMSPEDRKLKRAQYYAQNYEYRRSDPERTRAQKAADYRKHKQRSAATGARWRKANPARLKELARGWSARRRSFKQDGVSAAETGDWARAQKKVCHWCGKRCTKRYDIDHITALSRGGEHQLRNLCISCVSCNRSKGARDPIEWAQMLGKLL